MAYAKINKSGCCERNGSVQVRFDLFLEPTEPRYLDTYIQVPDIPEGTKYPEDVTKEWLDSFPKKWQLNPFHSHFVYFDPDVTDAEIKAEMDFHLPNFYAAYQRYDDKEQGKMRRGWAVEKRIRPLRYNEVEDAPNFALRASQVEERMSLIPELTTTTTLTEGKEYPATDIDIGAAATDRSGVLGATNTLIDLTNPANATGTLDTIEIWVNLNGANVKVGTFSGSGTSYDDRDYATIGNVAAGAKRTFTGQDIDVTSGDFIGCYSARIERDTSGGSGVYYKSQNQFGTGSNTYTLLPANTLSLYATGETPGILVTPTTASLSITGYAPTVTADGSVVITPTTASLSITGYAPTVTAVVGRLITPTTASLIITGYPPTVTGNPIPIVPEPALGYILEIHNSDGDLVSILENAYNRSYSQKINEPQELSFSLPADDDKTSGLVKPNEIWLRNYSTGTNECKFNITRTESIDDGGIPYIAIETKGYLSKLLHAIVVSYSPANQTPTQIVTALLTNQTLTPLITLGTIEPTGSYSFSWANTTVLKCLNDMLNAISGYIGVDNDNELTWLDDIGENKGQQIRYRKNITDVKAETDWEGLITRMYPVGNNISLTDYKPEYDTVDKDSDATYGYLNLKDYKCYNGWTGAGAALPIDVTVWSVGAEYSISFDSATGWANDNAKAIDGNLATSANDIADLSTNYITVLTSSTVIHTGIRWYLWDTSNKITHIIVQVTYNGTTWNTLFNSDWDPSWFNTWVQNDFTTPTTIKGARILVTASEIDAVYMGEMEIRTTYTNETSNFIQGADEGTFRCAIADYNSGSTYYVSYTHAAYLKNFTGIEAYGDISGVVNYHYANNPLTLWTFARSQLDSISTASVSYSSDVLFLNGIDTNFSFDELKLGSIVDLIHEPLNIDNSIRVVGMTKNLDNPLDGSIDIQSKVKSLTEAFRALWEKE